MNPQDVKTNADRLRVRDDYIAVLKQQEANLQKTANALSVMKQTGQPPIAPSDMRSSSEKFADIERLKPIFRKQLMSLMDGKEAEIVMNVLDNQEIQAAVMIWGEIYNDLKGKYPMGVLAPVFVEYLVRFLKDYSKSVGFMPKSREEREALSNVDALKGAKEYMRAQQQVNAQEMENSLLAKEIRDQERDDVVKENQLQEQYNQAFNIASPEEIRKVAIDISGKQNPKSKVLSLAKRMLGFDRLTPDEIFRYSNPSIVELVVYLEYDYMRNFGQRFTQDEREALAQKDRDEILDVFTRIRGGDNVWGGEEVVEDIEQDPVQATMESMLGQIERRRALAEDPVQATMEDMLGQIESRYAPTVADITSEIRKGGPVGRPKIYSTEEQAKLGKVESNRRGLARKAIIRRVENEAKAAENDLKVGLKSGKIGREFFDAGMEEIAMRKSERITELLTEADLLPRIKTANIPLYTGASEFQGLRALIPVEGLPIKSEKEVPEPAPSIPIPEYMKMTPDDFKMINSLSKVDLMQQFTTTALFNTLDVSEQKRIKQLLYLYENPTSDTTVDDVINALDETFEVIRRSDVKRVIGYGVKSTASGAAKHVKRLITGRGLKGKREFSDKIDKSVSTLPETKSYVPFGKYVLNHRRLNDNKLMVRTVKGGAISGIPTLAISPVLGGIIKRMVGGALPSYNEMSKLSEEEQNTLYKVFKMSEVDNADLLPAPNKTKEEEEFNRFQILKGQISAGNDSAELIKEFKLMLLKFIHNGKVPRGQGMEIVCDLMAMGH